MRKKKLLKLLHKRFGTIPDLYYFAGDLENIKTYYEYRNENDYDSFLLDDITWNDLSLDRVFKRINACHTTSGEQYLYYMLRSPLLKQEIFESRLSAIKMMEEDSNLRLKLQCILEKLGRSRRSDLSRAFSPEVHGLFWLMVYLLLMLLIPFTAILAFFLPSQGIMALLLAFSLNNGVHEYRKRRTQKDFDTVNYTASMIFTLNKVRKIKSGKLDKYFDLAYKSLDRLRSVLRIGGVVTDSDDAVQTILTHTLLLDLISYELIKNKLGRCHDDVFAIHEHLGKIDASISIASYRKSLMAFAQPEIDFNGSSKHIEVLKMIHPLIDNPVENDLVSGKSLLITGSNASGKSTYLKTAALCVVMAQSICTCTAERYKAAAFRLYSSMALSDNILAGESYYIVETKSLKRILDATNCENFVICVIDEVLRGTNTIERIAASSVVLDTLAKNGAICIAATHDIELCALLDKRYALYHFEEQLGESGMNFDYIIRSGEAKSKNAINLLKIMGFDETIVENAHNRANNYLKDGLWS